MAWVGWGIAAVATLLLLGQYFSCQADLFVTIANPRPTDEEQMVVTIEGWGFSLRTPQPFIASAADWGLADVRVYATRRQTLTSILTAGLRRPLTVAWRGHAGVLPLGDA